MRRSAISALTTLALLGAGTLVSTPAVAAPLACGGISTGSFSGSAGGSEYLCAKEGDLLDVRIGDVHATQPSLGYDEVYYKLGRYTLGKDTINKKFDDWCEANGHEPEGTRWEVYGHWVEDGDPSDYAIEVYWLLRNHEDVTGATQVS